MQLPLRNYPHAIALMQLPLFLGEAKYDKPPISVLKQAALAITVCVSK